MPSAQKKINYFFPKIKYRYDIYSFMCKYQIKTKALLFFCPDLQKIPTGPDHHVKIIKTLIF